MDRASLDGIFRVRLLGSYDLNQKMVDAVGSVAIIFRHPDRRLANGNMFTEYDIAVQPRKDGKRREWTRHSRALAEIHAIDVPALPAAGETAAPQGGSVIEAAARAAATNHTA